MTCVWESLITAIPNFVFGDMKIQERKKSKIKPDDFVFYLKNKITRVDSIMINEEKLNEQQIEENYEHIKNFQVSSIKKGYYCSTCDPFLILVCYIFECSIFHSYLDCTILYDHPNPKFRIILNNSSGHMTHGRTILMKQSNFDDFIDNSSKKKKKQNRKNKRGKK